MPAPPVGLDITATALHAIVLKKRGKRYSLLRHASMPLQPGLVVDGEVVDVAGLSAAIQQFWAQQRFKDKRVAVGIASQRCIVRTVSLSRIKNAKELRNTIGFEVLDHLPVASENIVFDFHTIDSFKDDVGVERQRHVVVMSYRDSMERFRDAVAGAGLKLHRIDLAGFALMRSAMRATSMSTASPESPRETIALVDVGSSMSNVVIASGGVCELNRQLAFGSRNFSHMLSDQFGWSTEDAARVCDEAGVLPPGGIESPGDPYTDSRHVLQYVADQMAAELRTSFDYYLHNGERQHPVSRIVLSGEGALMRGLNQRLAAELGIPVDMIDLSPYLDTKSVEAMGTSHATYGTAFGLALEDAA